MLLILPARAEKPQALPAQAVGSDTMLAVYVDVTQFSPEMIGGFGQALLGITQNEQLKGQGLALPIGDPTEIADMLTTLRGSFLQAGGEGLMMTVEMPGEDSWSPPMNLLAKTNDKLDSKAMVSLLRTMGDGEMDATLESLGSGWQNIGLKSKTGDAVTMPLPKPDADVFAAFSRELTQHKKPIFSVAFRMQESMREMLDELEQDAKEAQANPGQQQDGQAQMLAGMMMGMFKPIRQLDTIGLSISEDGNDSMLVDVQMSFLDATSAQQFGNIYNVILMIAPVALAQAGQGGEIENMPDPATINQFFMKLRMQPDGKSLKLKLDKEFFDLVEKLAPLFEGFNEQQGDAFQL
jgi:hypothetical protein